MSITGNRTWISFELRIMEGVVTSRATGRVNL